MNRSGIGMFFVNQMIKLEQIKVAQNMQMLFITSLKLSELKIN